MSSRLNFGWSCLEGTSPYAIEPPASCNEELAAPAVELVRGSVPVTDPAGTSPTVTRGRPSVDTRLRTGEPVCSVVAGSSCEIPALPTLAGRHLYGDFCDSSLRSFRLEGGRAVEQRLLGLDVLLLSSLA